MTRSMRPAVVFVGAFVLLGAAACRQAPPSSSPAPSAAAVETKRYPIKGRVVSVDRAKKEVTLAHEEIPGFMAAMTMLFPIRDGELPAAFQPGAEVVGTLAVADEGYWLEGLAVTRPAGASPVASRSTPAPADPQPGAEVPDAELVDQDGRKLRLSEYQGHALALTFLFTRCPLPDYCPRMAGHFSRAQELLARDPALLEETKLLAISFDPAYDTPAVLKAWGARYQKKAAGSPFQHWRFATGSPGAIRSLGAFFGLEVEAEEGGFTHNLRTAVIGPDGRLRRLFRGNDWQPEQLVAELRSATPAAP
jgi:protein SCO1